ncbi:MAG: hypothetical protein P4L46_04635 [Fimbriimonas sp.]|nr:hypothetical protein [Fimbriimonas sp.]
MPLLTAILLCTALTKLPPDAGVTFDAPASRAKVLFPQLSKAMGFALDTSPQTEDEVLLIHVKDVPAKDLMDRIAKVANAEWRPEGSGYRLIRTPQLTKQATSRELEDRRAELKDAVDAAVDRVKGLPAWSASEAQKAAKGAEGIPANIKISGGGGISFISQPSSGTSSPAERAIPALLADIGTSKLASLAPGTRTVFALQPTPMQRALGGSSPRILREFIAQQRQFLEAYSLDHKSSDPSNGKTNVMVFSSAMAEPAPGNPDLGIGQAILVIKRDGSSLSTHLTVADTNGETIGSGAYTLDPVAKPPAKLSGIDPISISPLSKELSKNLDGGIFSFGGSTRMVSVVMSSTVSVSSEEPVSFTLSSDDAAGKKSKVSSALLERILHPEKFDPESFVPGEAFASAANALSENLVADLPDTSFYTLTKRVADEKVSPHDLVEIVGPEAGLAVQENAGWLTVCARHQATGTQNRVSREYLGPMLRTLDSTRILRLDDMAPFAVRQEKPASMGDIDGIYLQIVNHTAGQKAMNYLSGPWTLRFYAALTPAEKSAVQAGQPISFTDLTSQQVDWLSYDVFNSEDGPTVQQPRPNRRSRVVSPLFFGRNDSVLSERTQILPDGLPHDGRLVFRIRSENAVLGIENSTGNSAILTASRLASQMYQAERPEFATFGQAPKYDIFHYAKESTYTFEFQLLPRVTFTRSLDDPFIDLQGPAATFQGLPQDFQDQVNRQLSRLRSSLGKVNLNGDGGAAPPP